MPLHEEIAALLAAAEERAATEVEVWIPEKPGDRISGVVEELGTISTVFGAYNTSTIRVHGGYVENGKPVDGAGKLVRVAWMGAVLQAQFLRFRPLPDNVVAFHYQKDVTPAVPKGNDYALIESIVIDHTTGKAKLPVEVAVQVPTEEQLRYVDTATGELRPEASAESPVKPGRSPLEPREGEEPL